MALGVVTVAASERDTENLDVCEHIVVCRHVDTDRTRGALRTCPQLKKRFFTGNVSANEPWPELLLPQLGPDTNQLRTASSVCIRQEYKLSTGDPGKCEEDV